jgi:hypothetical protein
MADLKDGRAEARKILRCSTRVVINETVKVKGRTIDISISGISAMMDEPIASMQKCRIYFDAPAGSRILNINIAARAVYSTCVGTSGFRVGFQFSQTDEAGMKLIRQLLQ